ncbi:hypothetical protein [Leucobacter soli]|uniref:hypothetical protein n=1 Tax=Leucobacter soli TaxID=2812850 RepID=UPI003610C14A
MDSAVAAEWRALAEQFGSSTRVPDPLRRVLAPDPAYTPLQRFARALALLLPPYERLLDLDARERGLTDERRGSADVEEDATGESGLGLGADAGPDSDDAADGPGDQPGADDTGAEETGAEESGSADDSTPAAGESDRARTGEGRDTAEGADLFAAEHAAFVEKILATPMPAEGAMLDAVMDPAEMPDGNPRSDPNALAPGTAAVAAGRTALATYRERADALAAPIERMREVWARVIAERVARHPRMGRSAEPEGDELARESLADAVAESLAGAVRPNAYRRREALPRRARRAGSTDYVLLIDRSASMSGRPAECAADAALIMLEALAGVERDVAHAEARARTSLELDIRTALIVFDAEAHVVKPLSGGVDDAVRRALHAAIRAPRGATNDAAALAAAAGQLGIGRGRPLPRATASSGDGS